MGSRQVDREPLQFPVPSWGWGPGSWTVPVVIVTMTLSGHSYISFKIFLHISPAVSILHVFLQSVQMGSL